ncbi:MAG: hypothetical protein ACJ763_19425 [Bdellovibrionia bacterium]
MIRRFKFSPALAPATWALLLTLPSLQALAQDQILRPYTSVRGEGMGNVNYTTGLYDQNLFFNPARVTDNPEWRVTLLDPMVEVSSVVPGAVGGLIHGGSDFYRDVGDNAGDNYHARVQTTFPAFYKPPGQDGKWGFAIAVVTSTQSDVNLRRSFNVEPMAITDVGPAITVGRRFFDDNSLSIGTTLHAEYRLSSNTGFTFIDLIQGKSLAPSKTGGQGAGADLDLGMEYKFTHFTPAGVHFSGAFAVNNALGGKYSNIGFKPIKDSAGNPSPSSLPTSQPRTFNFGVAAEKDSMGVLKNTTLALEFTDFGNNTNGSIYRTIHMGGETHLSIFALRAGLNQGYPCAGLGIDLKFIQIDASTYGEEMSLNAGGYEDRRYALRFAIQI